jgi:beta-lactamase class A
LYFWIILSIPGDYMKNILIFLLLTSISFTQVRVPEYYSSDQTLTEAVSKIISELQLSDSFDVGEDGTEQISFAVIDMTGKSPVLAGYNMDNFIYPASVYKMYVAMEILKQVSEGKYSLNEIYVVKDPNAVDKSREIKTDPRPLLNNNDTVTINYLLDLMITRSDNSAANCLIDIAGRENINKTIKQYGWEGSEVTRKFLSRKFEDPGYEKIRGTETCALHAADFMYRIETNTLVNYWVSEQVKILLGRQLDKSKLAQGFPKDAMFYHKTGWWSYWTNDAGIVSNGKIKFLISCFMPVEEESAIPLYKILAERIFEVIVKRNQ